MVRFYAESFAPWCEKARWALDHHEIRYQAIEHVPLLGELRLRWAARRPFGKVSVPLLVAGEVRLADSLAIARWADANGQGAPLFPDDSIGEVEAWNERSERLMIAGRALLLPRMLDSGQALREQLPPFMPAALRPRLEGLAALGVRHLMRKYEVRAEDAARHEEAAREVLGQLTDALDVGPHLVCGHLSYADIAMATALQFFAPVDDAYIALGPASRAAWTHRQIAADIAQLVRWRDQLYARWRRPGERIAART